jgi:hypothetical protein
MTRLTRFGFMVCVGMLAFSGVIYAYSELSNEELGIWNEVALSRHLERIERHNQELSTQTEVLQRRLLVKDGIIQDLLLNRINPVEAIQQFDQLHTATAESMNFARSAYALSSAKQIRNYLRYYVDEFPVKTAEIQIELDDQICQEALLELKNNQS